MDELGRYYTSGGVSKLLVSCFLQDDPKSVLDIGVGGGALVHAARQRWNQADFYVADIDRKSIAEVSSALPFVKVLKIDGLSGKIDSRDRMTVGNIDVAICNPPYRRTQKTPAVLEVLRKAGLPDCRLLKKITSDIIFLAKNLAMLREGGELGIIVPDTIVSGREFELFRKDLITRHCVFGAIQIPDGVFKKTEARTHILLIRKGGCTPEKVQVRMSDRNGTTGPGLSVSKDALVERMDFTFHQWKSKNCGSQGKMTLGELNVEIKRGRQTKKQLEQMGIPYFHTSSFPQTPGDEIRFDRDDADTGIVARPGDILVARVGKRCIGKTAVVASGSRTITDCVYRLRAPDEWGTRLARALISPEGKAWMESNARGVCARVICKADLLSFSI